MNRILTAATVLLFILPALNACQGAQNRNFWLAIATGCPAYEEVAFPSKSQPPACVNTNTNRVANKAITPPPRKSEPEDKKNDNDLDRVHREIKKQVKKAGIELEETADGLKTLGLKVEKIKGPDGKTKEIKIKFDGDVSFKHGSHNLTNRATSIVNRVAAAMGKYPNTKAHLGGHTDSTGSRAYNQALSLRRAKSVRNGLVKTGNVTPDRILSVRGYADRQKIIPTNKSEQRNRRVEIRIIM